MQLIQIESLLVKAIPGLQPAKNFGGAKTLLATIMTSSICSQLRCNFFAMISLPTLVEEPFS